MDGTGLGRSDAAHGYAAPALRQAQCPRSAAVWIVTKPRGRALPRHYCERHRQLARGLDLAVVSSYIHSAQTKNAGMYAVGCFSRSYANSYRMGGRRRETRA